MSRKPNNFRCGGSGGSRGYRRFGGTGSLSNYNSGSNYKDARGNYNSGTNYNDTRGNYNSGSNYNDTRGNYNSGSTYNDGHGENHCSGSWTGGNFNRPYDNSANQSSNNNFGNNNIPELITQDEGQFKKFRDPHAQKTSRNKSLPEKISQQRDGHINNHNRCVGKQLFSNEGKTDGVNRYEDRATNSTAPNEQIQSGYPPTAASPAPSANLLQAAKSEPPGTSSPSVPPPIPNELPTGTEIEEKKEINIKQEKLEQKETKRIAKPLPSSSSSSEEDVICLGKLERKYVIEDDASEEIDESMHRNSTSAKTQCLICDKQGHTAFECQMICKNCSGPYHNMKSCPKPVNLSIMMQSFMEFCMGQMSQFNPDQKFTFTTNAIVNKNTLASEAQSKNIKTVRSKLKEPPKKLAKRNRKRTTKSSHDHQENDNEEEKEEEEGGDESEEEQTSESESESD